MSQNSSGNLSAQAVTVSPKRPYAWWFAFALPLWVLAGFIVAQLLVSGTVIGLDYLNVPFTSVNQSVLQTALAACVYVLTLVIVIGVPWWTKKRRTTRLDIGLARLPSWTDIGLGPVGFIIYLLTSMIMMYLATQFVPGFNGNEAQDIGFDNLRQYFEYLLAFVTLVIIAPFAEEILFRGYLYGKLRRAVPIWVAILITSVLFAFVHQKWNVAIDVFVLSVVMCSLREVTGNIWAGILVHTLKNGLAFYLLFINPTFLNTIGG